VGSILQNLNEFQEDDTSDQKKIYFKSHTSGIILNSFKELLNWKKIQILLEIQLFGRNFIN